jgi:hypothetical protein
MFRQNVIHCLNVTFRAYNIYITIGAPIVLDLENAVPKDGDFLNLAVRHSYETVKAELITVCQLHQTNGNFLASTFVTAF